MVNFLNVINGFALEFNQTFFYSYFLQIILVTYMFKTVGKGRYWKVLFYGSLLGFFGAIMEHSFLAWQQALPAEDKYTTNVSVLLFAAELGWITTEFSVPILNLIKLNSLSHVRLVKALNYITIALFCGFTFFRVEIGYHRFAEHRVDCAKCDAYHAQAFGVMAITDTILSIMIFLKINKSSHEYKIKKNNENISILTTFKKSSVFSLLIVDVISMLLSLTYIFQSTKNYAQPFHALKSNFLLILAVDAFVFKFKANTDGSTVRSYDVQSSNTNIQSPTGTVNGNGSASFYKQSKSSINPVMKGSCNNIVKLNSSNPNIPSLVKKNSIGNLSHNNLSNSNLSHSNLSNSNINHSNLPTGLSHSNLSNTNLSHTNIYTSQPIIPFTSTKQFGLFKNELMNAISNNNNNDTQINIDSPKPAANYSERYGSSAYMHRNDSNNSLNGGDYKVNETSVDSFTNIHDYKIYGQRNQNMNINKIYGKYQ